MLKEAITRIGISPFSAQQHLGVYRSFLVSVFIAKYFKGKTLLRIDDTNPHHQANINNLIDDLTQIVEPYLIDSVQKDTPGIAYVGDKSISAILESQRHKLYAEYVNILEKDKFLLYKEGAIYFNTKKYVDLYGDIIHLPFQGRPNRYISISKTLPQLYFPIAVNSGQRFLWHFTSVIDDKVLGITHVVRAQDKIDSQAPQAILNHTLKFSSPQYFYTKIMLSGQPLPKINDLTAMNISIQAIRSYIYGTITGRSEKTYYSFKEALVDFSPESVIPGQFYFDLKKLLSIQKHFF